jgi:hypothetical protein
MNEAIQRAARAMIRRYSRGAMFMPIIEGSTKLKTWIGEYDFAIDGGAISTIPLRSNSGAIPAGADIVSGYIDVITQLTSGGAATIGVNAEAAGDLVAAATGVATYTAGRKNVLPADASGSATAKNSIRTTAARVPAITVAAFALTAGKMRLVLNWR